MTPQLTIVTAADSSHFQCMINLLWTISRYAPTARVVAWDIGLQAQETALLNNVPPFYLSNWQLRTFDFSQYPFYFSLAQNSGFIAFRPVTMAAAAYEFGGMVLWLDADCQLRQPISEILAMIKKQGLYCANVKSNIGSKLSPSALPVTPELSAQSVADPGICGFDIDQPQIMALLDHWKTVTMDARCTAPNGATLQTHNPDSVWSVILHQSATANNWELNYDRLPGIMKGCDRLSLSETKFRCRAPGGTSSTSP
jgi:hypothetical protein